MTIKTIRCQRIDPPSEAVWVTEENVEEVAAWVRSKNRNFQADVYSNGKRICLWSDDSDWVNSVGVNSYLIYTPDEEFIDSWDSLDFYDFEGAEYYRILDR
jgi:hypothetical protein